MLENYALDHAPNKLKPINTLRKIHDPSTNLSSKPNAMIIPFLSGASDDQIDLVSQIIPFITAKQVLIVTNDVVAPLYLAQMQERLLSAGFHVEVCVLPDGEIYKNQDSINAIYDVLLGVHFARDCTLIALGGGVIGDMTGFAAASFMRGVKFYPSTYHAACPSGFKCWWQNGH